MKNRITKIKIQRGAMALIALLSLFMLPGCNVMEWPEEAGETYPFTLNLNFDDALPLYKEVIYSRTQDDSRAESDDYDIRYVVKVYKVSDENDGNRDVWQSYVFTRPYRANHDYSVTLSLPEGRYRFRVWSDHVATDTQTDYFYITDDFSDINLEESNGHMGNTELRDAFRGYAYGEVYDPELYEIRNGKTPDNSATAKMQRPMGRYEFISTDMDEFLDKVVENVDVGMVEKYKASLTRDANTVDKEFFWNGLTRDEVADMVGLNDYKVTFSYNAFMPSRYNLYTDKPSDSSTGITYDGAMKITEAGMQMGFDYILVDDQTTMNLNMQIFNSHGDLISSTSGVEVPVVRSKNTIVKGTFLTVTSGGGVTINPDFDGDDFNIEIK